MAVGGMRTDAGMGNGAGSGDNWGVWGLPDGRLASTNEVSPTNIP
jgi:hypothetical protein